MAKGDKIPGGLTDKKSVEDIAKKHGVSVTKIKKELDSGADIELEHTNSKDKAREIALDHLYEFPDYYTRLKKMEKEAEAELKAKKNLKEAYAKRMQELAGIFSKVEKEVIKESVIKEEDDFIVHEFEQKGVEKNDDDDNLYMISENTIIELDFIKEEAQEESSSHEVRHDSDRKGPSDSATWHDEGKEMKGEDGNMWRIKKASNGVNRWVKA